MTEAVQWLSTPRTCCGFRGNMAHPLTIPSCTACPPAHLPVVAAADKGGCGVAGEEVMLGGGSVGAESLRQRGSFWEFSAMEPQVCTNREKKKSMNAWSVFGLVENDCISFPFVYS